MPDDRLLEVDHQRRGFLKSQERARHGKRRGMIRFAGLGWFELVWGILFG